MGGYERGVGKYTRQWTGSGARFVIPGSRGEMSIPLTPKGSGSPRVGIRCVGHSPFRSEVRSEMGIGETSVIIPVKLTFISKLFIKTRG